MHLPISAHGTPGATFGSGVRYATGKGRRSGRAGAGLGEHGEGMIRISFACSLDKIEQGIYAIASLRQPQSR